MKTILYLLILVMITISCRNTSDETANPSEEKIIQNKAEKVNIPGTYVDDSYRKRMDGYDWVGIQVTQTNDTEIRLAVRSRADKKEPTCLLDLKAYKKNDSLYEANANGSEINIVFSKDGVHITAENEGALFYYCSGGATVAGTYSKIPGELDSSQVDQTKFYSNLELQAVGFEITSKKKESGETLLQISPYGLSAENRIREHVFKGSVMNAEIEDLNADGFPEVMVYIQKENNQGEVIAYSVNSGKSMSMVTMKELNSELKNAYQGFDEYRVVENSLFRRFPKFEFGSKTNVMVEVKYELEDAENSRIFVPLLSQEYEL